MKKAKFLIKKMNDSRKKFPNQQTGFTLIEVMLALLIMAVAIGSYVGTNMLIQRNAEVQFERSIAVQDANRVIERMQNAAISGIFPGNVVAAFPNGGFVLGFTNLTSEVVNVHYTSTTSDPLDATVTVNWQSHTGRGSTLALRSMLTQR